MDDMRNKVVVGLFWTYGERIASQIVSLIVSIILARLLVPAEFGVIAIVMVFIAIANVFVSDGVGNALVQKKDSDELDFSTIFYFALAMSLILYVLLFFSAPFIAEFYNMSSLKWIIRVISLRLLVTSLNTVQHAYISKEMQFRKFFIATLFGTICSGIVGVSMAYAGFGVWALVVQYMTNTTIDTIVLWFVGGWKPQWMFSFQRLKGLLSYGLNVLGANLINAVYGNLRTLMIGKIFCHDDLAYYNRGKQLPSIIITNLNTSIAKALFPAMSLAQNDKERFKYMLRKSMQVSALIISPMLIGLAACGEEIILLLYTDKWLSAIPFLQILSVQYMLQPIHKSNLQAIKAIGRSDILLKMEIIKKTYGIILLLVSVLITKDLIYVALSGVVASLCDAVYHMQQNRKLLSYTLKEQLQDFLPPVLCSGIMFIIVQFVRLLPIATVLILMMQVFVGVVIYIMLVSVFKLPAYAYVKTIILEILNRKKKSKLKSKYEIL